LTQQNQRGWGAAIWFNNEGGLLPANDGEPMYLHYIHILPRDAGGLKYKPGTGRGKGKESPERFGEFIHTNGPVRSRNLIRSLDMNSRASINRSYRKNQKLNIQTYYYNLKGYLQKWGFEAYSFDKWFILPFRSY